MSKLIRIFRKHPLILNCLSYGSLCLTAGLSQQILTKRVLAKELPSEPIDFASVGRFGVVGTFINGPTLFAWYKWLDAILPGAGTSTVIKKLLLDQLVYTPILLSVFFISMSTLERKEDPFLEWREKFASTYRRACMFWIPASTINFLFIKPRHRVIYVGTLALLWLNILAWIKNQKTKQNPGQEYKWLDYGLPGTTVPTVIKKLVLDQFGMTPVLLAVFFISMSVLERKEDPFLELREKFSQTFQRSCMFWIPATTINFLFVKPRYRVIYVGVCALAWLNILSWIKSQQIEEKALKPVLGQK